MDAEGVRSYDYKLMAKDFEMQHALRPTLSKAVFHGILSFYPGEKIADEKMIEIAKNYLQKMKHNLLIFQQILVLLDRVIKLDEKRVSFGFPLY